MVTASSKVIFCWACAGLASTAPRPAAASQLIYDFIARFSYVSHGGRCAPDTARPDGRDSVRFPGSAVCIREADAVSPSQAAPWPCFKRSLVPKCLDWIEAGGATCGIPAEEHTDCRREPDGDEHRGGRRRGCPAGEMAEQCRAPEAEGEPDDATEHAHGDALDEELREHVGAARADGHADADLARPLGHGDEHDVHDPDAADDERDRRDRG